jgi:hypothetical protein
MTVPLVNAAGVGAVDSAPGGAVAAPVLLAVLMATPLLAAVVWLSWPGELRGVSLPDRWRIRDAVSRYDFWLGLRGVSARPRRERRAELRANLWEAARRVGARQALATVGPMRTLARDGVLPSTGPRWGVGIFAGLLTLELVVALQVLLTTVVADVADAAGVARVRVPVTLVPGMTAVYERLPGGGISFGASPGPAPLVIAGLVFVTVARPWRLLRSPAGAPPGP